VASGNDQLLFLHVQKTGGHWVYEAMRAAGVELRTEGARHARLREVRPNGRFTFAFVRDPLTWYGSWWQHCRVIDPIHRVQAFISEWEPDRFINLPFEQYLEGCMNWWPGFVSGFYRRYTGPPEAPIDFVGHFERLADDLVRALQLAGQNFNEEVLRAFPRQNVGGPLPPCRTEIRERLIEVERETYKLYYDGVVASASTPGP
jgi:hypothetical protein